MNRVWRLIAAASFAAMCACVGEASEVSDSVLTISKVEKELGAWQYADRDDFHTVRFESESELRIIGDYCFAGCVNLRNVDFPISLRTLGEGAFTGCESLESVSLPRGVSQVPKQCFSWCAKLRRVDLPPTIADIASHAFAYCSSLDEIYLPPRTAHIGSNAFSFCASLSEIELPASLTELESYAFAECVALRRAVLPANRRLLGELIFYGCRRLEEIVELSAMPPEFDCASTLFDEGEKYMYRFCRLIVRRNAVTAYKAAPGWRLFERIEGTQ